MHFCKNEIGLARNVKDRLNSKVTIKNLEKIQIELKNIKDISLGLFIFVGIDEYENQIFKIIVPKSSAIYLFVLSFIFYKLYYLYYKIID